MTGKQLKWWRDEPSFSQRVTITIEDDGNKMVSKGEMSRDGAAWEDDLSLTYERSSKSLRPGSSHVTNLGNNPGW